MLINGKVTIIAIYPIGGDRVVFPERIELVLCIFFVEVFDSEIIDYEAKHYFLVLWFHRSRV